MAANWAQLKQLRDELKLQAHLFEKEALDGWKKVLSRIQQLESKLISNSESLGDAEKHFFVGSDEEIAKLIDELKTLRKSTPTKTD